MPLKRGSSEKVVRENIREMIRAGHAQNVAVAAAMRAKRESQKRRRG